MTLLPFTPFSRLKHSVFENSTNHQVIGEATKHVLKTRNEKRETRNGSGNLLICQAFLIMTALFLSTGHLHAASTA
ncbi:MAG: hypothetical protein M0R76_07565, partial [Proteobacteria bacterium]|nr:hypothetical protein [Pseudomonadota bacterium]